MSVFKEIVQFFSPPEKDAAPEAILRWRLVISMFVFVCLLFGSWSFGLLPYSSGFAFAEDVDNKIAAAVDPINARLNVQNEY